MIEDLQARHRRPLAEIFAAAKLQSEYFLYGLFAHGTPAMARHCTPTTATLSVEIKQAPGPDGFDGLAAAIADTRQRPFLWVHGFVPDREALVARLLATVAPADGPAA